MHLLRNRPFPLCPKLPRWTSIAAALLPALAASSTIYVSPTGSDLNNGLFSAQQPGTQNGPVATLQRARDAVRQFRTSTGFTSEVTVQISSGTYTMRSSLVLSQFDANTRWRASGNGPVRLTGGLNVTGWSRVSAVRIPRGLNRAIATNVFQVNLTRQGITDWGTITPRGHFFFSNQTVPLELIYNDQPMTLARHPNVGYLSIASASGTTVSLPELGTRKYGDVANGWAFTFPRHDWADYLLKIQSYQSTTQTMSLPSVPFGMQAGGRLRMVNFIEDLDVPGEYFMNRQTGDLLFYPPGSMVGASTVVTSLSTPIIDVMTTRDITFEGLIVEAGRGIGIKINNCENVDVRFCTFRNLGLDGVWYEKSLDSTVYGSDFMDLGGRGVRLEGGDRATLTPGNLLVDQCRFRRFGRLVQSYRPAVDVIGVGNRVANCTISDAPHAGVLFTGNDHIIERNHFTNLGLDSDDAGAVYAAESITSHGTKIRNNLFVNLNTRLRPEPWRVGIVAVYLDENISGVEVTGNIFHNCNQGIAFGGGFGNSAVSNMFISTPKTIHVDARGKLGSAHKFVSGGGYEQEILSLGSAVNLYRSRYPVFAFAMDNDLAMPWSNRVQSNISDSANTVTHIDPSYTLSQTTVVSNLVSVTQPALNALAGDYRPANSSSAASIGYVSPGNIFGLTISVGAGVLTGGGQLP